MPASRAHLRSKECPAPHPTQGGRGRPWEETLIPGRIAASAAAMWVLACCATQAASAGARKAAVFAFEVPDVIELGEYLPKPSKEGPKIAVATQELRKLLAAGGLEVVDLTPLAAKIKDKQPLHKCNGCEVDLAKEAGAEVLVVGLVEKASDVLLNMTIEIRDVETNRMQRAGSIVVQGNTEEMWLRSVRWLVKNRLLAEEVR